MKYLLENYSDEAAIEKKAIRAGFGEGIVQAAAKDESIVVLNADLPGSLKLQEFIDLFPERYIQVGVAEQNMAGIATGLESYGKKPVISSFAAFSPGLNFSQIRLAALDNQNLKIVGSHYGLSLGADGASAQMNADVGMMKSLANMTILNPADFNQAIQATNAMFSIDGPVYLRVAREKFPVFINPESEFIIGKAQILREGDDLTIFATGSMVYEALKTAQSLKDSEGLEVSVVNLPTVKPLDEETVTQRLGKTGVGVVIEEHNIWGGLGESIARINSATENPARLLCLGVNDTFGESGDHWELWKKYGLDYESLTGKIRQFLV